GGSTEQDRQEARSVQVGAEEVGFLKAEVSLGRAQVEVGTRHEGGVREVAATAESRVVERGGRAEMRVSEARLLGEVRSGERRDAIEFGVAEIGSAVEGGVGGDHPLGKDGRVKTRRPVERSGGKGGGPVEVRRVELGCAIEL